MKRRVQVKSITFEVILPEQTVTKAEAVKVIYLARQHLTDAPEMSLDEINAEISAAGLERKK